MRKLLLACLACMAPAAQAQDLARRHRAIDSLYAAGQYEDLARAIEDQLRAAEGTPWQDSTYRYVYKYGRALRKMRGADAGVAAAEDLVERVRKRGKADQELEALFDLSWTYYDAGRLRDCVRADSLAVVVAGKDPSIRHDKRGQARQYLAFDFSILGEHRSSARWAQAALDEYAKADGIPPVQWAESYNALGAACWHLGRIREAEAAYRKALEALEPDSSEAALMRRASTNGNLGVMWQNAGDLARSKIYYHESLKYSGRVIASTKDPSNRDEAIVARSRSFLNLATAYFASGDAGRAREFLGMAWKDRSAVFQPDDPQLLAVRDRMAELELAEDQLDKAEALTLSYVEACRRKFGKESEEYARSCARLGDIAGRKGQLARADSLYAESMAAGRAGMGESTNAVLLQALQGRAAMNGAAARHAQAVADLEKARAIAMQMAGAAHYRVARLDVLLAEQAFALGRPAECRTRAQAALAAVRDRVQALQASRVPHLFPDPHILPDAIFWKVRAERAMGAAPEGGGTWNADLDLAIRSLMRSQAAIDDNASKLLLMAAQTRLFDLALDVAFDNYRKSGAEQDLQRFLDITETDRSLLLRERLNGFSALHFTGVPDSLLALEQELRASLAVDPDDPQANAGLDRRERQYTAFLHDIERHFPKYFDLRYGERTASLAEIRQRLLAPDRQLLTYARTKDAVYAVVIGLREARIVRINGEGIGDAVREMNGAITARRTAEYVAAAYRLHQLVFAPVADLLTAGELLIIPDGELRTVNFDLLLSNPGPGHYRDHLLIRRHTIAYLLSATTAVQFADLARERAKGVLAVAPGFTDEMKRQYLASLQDTARLDHDFLHYVRQPFAVRTAMDLGRSLSANVLTGGDASEKSFRREASKYGILYLGTHAEMDPAAPMQSRLVLSKGGNTLDADDDGYLHAYEIYELDLRAQLAVLTACESGAGKEEAGEGIRSLGASFAYAGCPSLVVALWNIDEKTSAGIMARFHGLLADGMPKHAALRQAKLDYLDKARDGLAHPYYWGGLVLIGDVEPVAMPVGHGLPWTVMLVVLLAVTGLAAWWIRRAKARRQ